MEGVAGRDEVVAQLEQTVCTMGFELIVGAPGDTPELRARIERAVEERLAGEGSLGWSTVDLRPERMR